ncbi:alpha-galactosidase A precursor [Aspergillus carlsbadensis]|nr:alpha-galactosidase A precursor [Aspergillus carlsbadensis]
MNKQPKIELLQAEVDEDDQSLFRLLVDGHSIKYITIEPGIYGAEDMCFGPSLVSLLPDLPPGNWNDGLVAKNPDDGQAHFAHARVTQFPAVQNTWHATTVDYLDLAIGRKLRTGIYEATSSLFGAESIIAKFARFPWEIGYLESETTAYQWINGHSFGPRFLGHLTENDRVIGFLLERITGARHAGAEDVEVCQEALSRLHGLGVRHGDINGLISSSVARGRF